MWRFRTKLFRMRAMPHLTLSPRLSLDGDYVFNKLIHVQLSPSSSLPPHPFFPYGNIISFYLESNWGNLFDGNEFNTNFLIFMEYSSL